MTSDVLPDKPQPGQLENSPDKASDLSVVSALPSADIAPALLMVNASFVIATIRK